MARRLTIAALMLATAACKFDPGPSINPAPDTGVQVITGETKSATVSQTPPPPNADGSTTVTVTDLPNPSVPVVGTSTPPVIVSPVVVQPTTPPPSDIITIPDPAPAPATTTTAAAGCASLTNPKWAAHEAMAPADAICTATKTCDSVWKGDPEAPENDSPPTITAGHRYYVTPIVSGVVPSDYSGTAVGAIPVDELVPTTRESEFDSSCFQ